MVASSFYKVSIPPIYVWFLEMEKNIWPTGLSFFLSTDYFLQGTQHVIHRWMGRKCCPITLNPGISLSKPTGFSLCFWLARGEDSQDGLDFSFMSKVNDKSGVKGCSMLSTLISLQLRPLAGAMEGSIFWCQDDVVASVRKGATCKRMCVAHIEIGSFVQGWASIIYY